MSVHQSINFIKSLICGVFLFSTSAYAIPSSPYGRCGDFLIYHPENRSLALTSDEWERLPKLLMLSNDGITRARRIVNFTVAALSARAQDRTLANLTNPLLDEQARALLLQQDEILSSWPNLSGGSPETAAKSMAVQAAFRELNKTLHMLIDSQEEIPWSAVYQMTVLTGAFEEQSKLEFRAGKGKELELTFRELFGYEFTEDLGPIRQWAIALRDDSRTKLDVILMQRLLDEAFDSFKTYGIVTVPLAQTLPKNEALAIGFLPVHLVQFDLHNPRPQSQWLNGPITACRDMIWFDLADINPKVEYHVTGLCQPMAKMWTEAINASWYNWFAALGGFENGKTPISLA